MKITIIIPVYKVEDYIERNLQSVISQSYSDMEVILVDDASPDNSISIAQKLINNSGRKDMFKILTHERNKGLSAARNTGVKQANGDYIFFLDSDDELYDSNSIAILAENALKTGADAVIGNYMGIRSDSSYESKYNTSRLLKGTDLVTAFVKGDIPIMAWNKLISRHYFITNDLKFKEGILNEDELFSYHMLFTNPQISLIGNTTYKYYIRPGSIMTTINKNRLVSPVIVYEDIVKRYKAIGGNDKMILRNFDHFAFKRYVDILLSNANNKLKRNLYKRLRDAQRSINGTGKMRYLFNVHIFLPKSLGYACMYMIAKRYAKTRNLISGK